MSVAEVRAAVTQARHEEWARVSFQAMLTVPYRSLTASRGKSLEANLL